jgi:hypothetical protein
LLASGTGIPAAPAGADESPAEPAHTLLDHEIPVASSDGAAEADESWSQAYGHGPMREFRLAPDGLIHALDGSGRTTVSTPNPTQFGCDLAGLAKATSQVLFDRNSGAPGRAGFRAPLPLEQRELEGLVEEAAQRFGVEPGFAAAIIAAEYHGLRDALPAAGKPPVGSAAVAAHAPDACDRAWAINERVKLIRALKDELGSPLLVAAGYFAAAQRFRQAGSVASFEATVDRDPASQERSSSQGETAGAALGGEPPAAAPDKHATTDTGVIAVPKRRRWFGGVMHF